MKNPETNVNVRITANLKPVMRGMRSLRYALLGPYSGERRERLRAERKVRLWVLAKMQGETRAL